MDEQTKENTQRTLKALVRSAGHALRSPLSVIYQTATNMTDNADLDAGAADKVNEIFSSSERGLTAADKVIRLLQVMNCVGDGQPHLAIRLSEAAGRAQDNVQAQLTDLGCGVVAEIPHDLPPVAFASGIDLQQLIQTVLLNVARYANNPIVYLSAHLEQDIITVSVGNTHVPEGERVLSIDEFISLQRDDMLALDVFTSYCLLQKEGCDLWMTANDGTDGIEDVSWMFSLRPA